MRLWPRSFLTTCAVVAATQAAAEKLSFYGTSGLVDMPTARVLDYGHLGLTASTMGTLTQRTTMTFQLLPRLQGTFRYTRIDNYDLNGALDRFDRSFDVSYLLLREGKYLPAVAVGIRDFGGTGTFSAEYVVATKEVLPGVTVTGGIGWGRLAGRNPFESPLTRLDPRFGNRPSPFSNDITTTGRLDYNVWFRGDTAFFGGIEWQPDPRWTLTAEYSSDIYDKEAARGLFEQKSPLNFGVNYAFDNGVNLGLYSLYGTDAGLRLNYIIDPDVPAVAGSRDTAPPALAPQAAVAAASWNTNGDPNAARELLRARLADEGLTLEGYEVRGGTARVSIVNRRFDASAQALGRAARIMVNTLPLSATTFEITFLSYGLPLSTTRIQRSDMLELEQALDGSWQSFSRAQISDAFRRAPEDPTGLVYPGSNVEIDYYIRQALFDPDSPIRLEYGVELEGTYAPRPGLIFSLLARQELGGNLSSATRRSNSIVQRVRSESFEYARRSQTELTYLTAEYFFRPGPNLFGRVSAGYLEPMFGGISTELLWYPIDSAWAFGAELNYVRQRNYESDFGFREYETATGHVSAYYDLGNGFTTQLDVGRYLAGDWGATFALKREYENGFKIGAFATLTDMPFEDFGEGSFDKGITLEIPASWFFGNSSPDIITQIIRPILRDGGARLDVRNRLYPMAEITRRDAFADSWGRFWR